MDITRTHRHRWGGTAALMAASAITSVGSAQEVAEVVVTGSHILRPNLTQPTPVTTIASDDLRVSGTPDLGQLLSELPSLGSTGTLAGNTNSFSDLAGLNLPDLRRLGTARTLTLVNGKRHVGGSPGSTAVDLGSIPVALVDQVEIITGGASAVYGSDAVSGVINIIMRQDFEGIQGSLEYGQSWEGSYGENLQASLALGNNFDEGRGNFTISILRDEIGDVQANDVQHADDWGTVDNPENTGEEDGIPDRLVVRNVISELIDENAVLLLDPLPISFANPQGVVAFDDAGNPRPQQLRENSNSFAFGNFPNGCDFCFELDDYVTIIPEVVRTAFQTTARYDLADAATFYVDAKYVTSDVKEELQPSFNFGDVAVNVADNPFLNEDLRTELLNAGVAEATLARFHADAGSRRNLIERETKRVVAGFDGDFDTGFGNISYDVFYNYGETNNVVKGLNRRVTDNFLAAVDAIRDPATGEVVCRDPSAAAFPDCVPFNPFGRTNTPEAIAYSFTETTEEQELIQENAGFSLVSDTEKFFSLPAGPIEWALGFEWRQEETSTDGDSLVQSGLTETAPQPDQTGGYKVSEGFLEISVPILKDVFLADEVTLDAAYRAADYSHSGSADAWKLGLIWAPLDQIRLRGTISEAVRAPNITEAFLPATPGFEIVADPCDADRINNDPDRASNCAALGLAAGFQANDNVSVNTLSSGNIDLDAEESRSYTIGIVYQPTWAEGLSMTLDYYDIEITDAITAVEPQDIVDNCVDASGGPDQDFCGLFTRDPTTQDIDFVRSTFVNASKLETKGIDLELRFTRDEFLGGDLVLSFVGTYLDELNEFVFQDRPDEIDIERGEIGDPIHAYRATAYYTVGDFTFGWKGRYTGSSRRYEIGTDICEDVSPCELDEQIIHDLNVRYLLPSEDFDVELYAGVVNLLDEEPPRGILGTEVDEAIYDALGRRWFFGVRSTF